MSPLRLERGTSHTTRQAGNPAERLQPLTPATALTLSRRDGLPVPVREVLKQIAKRVVCVILLPPELLSLLGYPRLLLLLQSSVRSGSFQERLMAWCNTHASLMLSAISETKLFQPILLLLSKVCKLFDFGLVEPIHDGVLSL